MSARAAVVAERDSFRQRDDLSPQRFLVERLHWTPVSGPPLRVRCAGRQHLLRCIAQGDGLTALLHETRTAEYLPGYAARREIRGRVARRHAKPVIIFAHALRGSEIWQWSESAAGAVMLYREHSVFAGCSREALRSRLLPSGATEPASARDGELERAVARLLIPALIRRARRYGRRAWFGSEPARGAGRAGEEPWRAVLALIEGSATPGLVRAFWRALREFAVLDPRCGSGERLHTALRVLETLYDACLERMQVWADELIHTGTRHRPEERSDFRRVLARANDTRRHPSRRHFVRGSILCNNLFGVDPHPGAVAACADRLLGGPGSEGGAVETRGAPLNLRCGEVRLGFLGAAELHVAVSSAGGADAAAVVRRLEEAAEVVERGRRLMADAFQEGDGDASLPPPSSGILDERIAGLRAELDSWRAREHGVADDAEAMRRWSAEHRPVHLRAEFPDIARRGGFDVVLGEPALAEEVERRMPPSPRHATRQPRRRGDPLPQVRETLESYVRIRDPRYDRSPPPAMSDQLSQLEPASSAYPPSLRRLLGDDAPTPLYLRGDPDLLTRPLLAIFCSVRVPGDIILRSLDAARELRGRGVATIGGFQSPLERECLTFLLRGTQPVVASPARGVEPFRLPRPWREALGDGRLLLASRFPAQNRRPTTRMAEMRNLLVAALAERVLIAHATPSGRTHHLARTLVGWGKAVFAWDDPHNEDLLRLGVRPAVSLEEVLDTPRDSPARSAGSALVKPAGER
jgi:hypothetical protein